MASSLLQKLRIGDHDKLLTLNAPAEFRKQLGKLPAGVSIVESGKDHDQVHWFVLTRKQLEKEMSRVMKLLKENVMVWVYYPKGTSKIQTDLSRDAGWDCLMKESDRLTWVNLISFNETWSAFGFRAKTETDRKKESKPRLREVFNWVDPVAKTVTLPPDLLAAFRKNKKESGFFDSLSFTNKKEYIEWIVSAKREETRTVRIKETLERLGKGWKNPRNL